MIYLQFTHKLYLYYVHVMLPSNILSYSSVLSIHWNVTPYRHPMFCKMFCTIKADIEVTV